MKKIILASACIMVLATGGAFAQTQPVPGAPGQSDVGPSSRGPATKGMTTGRASNMQNEASDSKGRAVAIRRWQQQQQYGKPGRRQRRLRRRRLRQMNQGSNIRERRAIPSPSSASIGGIANRIHKAGCNSPRRADA
ncbi:hypothetical protein [Bradyrhizobium sp. RP6]|uniref:hypothetical protein n=1 Tax=Bradyrhizobium sp. RP6 TaxID=2489596 RepID=UPI001FE0EE3F|nr:hypothetical protein [Bradyrhizobium sp. RP6]